MSLLMKALEKAAKDRGDAQQKQPGAAVAPASAPAAAPATAKPSPAAEFTLEPLTSPAPPPEQTEQKAQSRGKSAGTRSRDQARAATVMQATTPTVTARSRVRPVMALGILAGVAALGLAIYVYLQITNPGLFIRQQPTPPGPLAQAPAPTPPPIAIGAVVAPAGPDSKPAIEKPPEAPPRAPRAAPQAQQTVASAPAAPRDSIRVSPGTAGPQLDPRMPLAYSALQSGNLEIARRLYADSVSSDPRNINALLGLAAIAMQEGQSDDASRLYFNVLELEPRNAYAQTGLIALMGRADPLAAESRLKQLIAREPLPSLYFTLGNLYADQSRWAEAQQAYFQAHHLEPANPDYAYNLAVGLEHVGQSKLAAGFYQRAVAQAQAKGRAGFNLGQAQDRIRQLASRPN